VGNVYTNYTLKGPSRPAVARALTGRSAFVTPAQGCVVVFDEQSDEQDTTIIAKLAARLSRELGCPLLAVLNHDDDILWYQLYLKGELADEYDSSPGYFDASAKPTAPAGGDAQKLGAAFGARNVAEIESVLRKSSFDEGGYLFAIDRHTDLARVLAIPSFGVGAGFRYIPSRELPDGVEESNLLKVTAAGPRAPAHDTAASPDTLSDWLCWSVFGCVAGGAVLGLAFWRYRRLNKHRHPAK
jgi:hypothetical protein